MLSPADSGHVAHVERLDDATIVVPMPTGIPFVPWTNCIVLVDDEGRAHLVDPGVDAADGVERLLAEIGAFGVEDVASIVVTHFHPDHIGLAGRLRAATGAPLVMGELESRATQAAWRTGSGRAAAVRSWGVPDDETDELLGVGAEPDAARPVPDVLVAEGDVLDVAGRRIEVLVTPGHTPGHVCLRDVDRRRVLTGDHVLPTINPGLGLGGGFAGNPLGSYLDGLRRIAAFDDHEALPGHEARFTGLADRCAALADHHLRRLGEVAAILTDEPDATVHDIATRVTWSSGWDGLRGFHRLSGLGQIAMHADLVRSGDARHRLRTDV